MTTPELENSPVSEEVQTQMQFEDLSIAELIGVFFRSPRMTFRALVDVATSPVDEPIDSIVSMPLSRRNPMTFNREGLGLCMYGLAFILAFWGSIKLVASNTVIRSESQQLAQGMPYLIVGFIVWLLAEVLLGTWQRKPDGQAQGKTNADLFAGDELWDFRLIFAGMAIPFSMLAWFGTADNQFSQIGFGAWVLSITFIVIGLAPASWHISSIFKKLRAWGSALLADKGTLIVLLLIMLIATYFRVHNLDGVPPEMTSDHKEKLEDAQRVVEGARDVFFSDNGGREGFQMYALALLSKLPCLEMNFTLLKILAVIESLLTIPVLWLMGRTVFYTDSGNRGNVIGLMVAALVAVSYWHVAITRLSLRIVLTPLVAAVLLIFLSRCVRYNRRGDYILAGLTLGFGLYTYQAVRMMPVVVVVAVGLGILYNLKDFSRVRRYLGNLFILIVVSFIVFVPLFRFSIDHPELFWMRTTGRLFGDSRVQEINATGNIIERDASLMDRVEAFGDNMPALATNIRNALLMFNWKGDVAWINGVPNHPAMDSFSGAFLIVGLAAWLILMIRERDPVYVLVPLMVFIMLLPSALAIGMPLENPSATRTSGSLPPVYLMAALPLALIVSLIWRVIKGRMGIIVSGGVVTIIILGAYSVNSAVYFNDYLASYRQSWRPHSEPGEVLRGFALSDGGFGNAYFLGYPHWLDHIIVGMEAGILDWPQSQGIVLLEMVPNTLSDAYYCSDRKYRLDPERDLLFFYHEAHEEGEKYLMELFPSGRSMFYDSEFNNGGFMTYRVPALGLDGFRQFAQEMASNPACEITP